MALDIVRSPLVPRITKIDFKEHAGKELVTWWYRELVRGRGSIFQPNALVCFRVLGANNELTHDFVHRRVALTELGQFKLGTIWHNQTCKEEVKLDTETFQVDFDPGAWRYYSIAQDIAAGRPPLIPTEAYELHQAYQHHKPWLLQFPFSDGAVGLLVPCLEFFNRYYGRSEHVKRILATYPWKTAREELLAPLVMPPEAGTWPINMRKRTVNGDAVLLAHLEYDDYARRQASAIWSELDAAQGPSGTGQAFVRIGPWFKGPARLRVKGIWIEKGRSFLGLQVVGGSDPSGVPIFRDRENTNKTGPIPGSVQRGAAWDGVPPRQFVPKHTIVDVTNSETPDHGAGSIEIEEPEFVLLGEPRTVVDMRRPTTNSTGGKSSSQSPSDRYSGDATAGAGKGVGYGSFHAKTVMESSGVLRDVWNMLKRIEVLHPEIVQKVEFFAADGSFSAGEEPTLPGFAQFSQEERDTRKPRDPNWPLLDTKEGTPRGALLARVHTPKGHIYFFEIQRRPRTIKKSGEKDQKGEQSFMGLVFKLSAQASLTDWIAHLLDQVRYTTGVLSSLAKRCPGEAFAFPHKRATAEHHPQERPVIRAFALMGIRIPETLSFNPPPAASEIAEETVGQ